jgi:CBS domain-containing protein
MQTYVVTVSPEEPLLDIHRLFVEEEIHGAPVVDEQDRVLGVISSSDLLRAVSEEHETVRATPSYLRDFLEFSGPDWSSAPEDFQDRLRERVASEAMTDGVVTVALDAPVAEIAGAMRQNKVHRVLVLEDGVLRGIISSFDLVALLEKGE